MRPQHLFAVDKSRAYVAIEILNIVNADFLIETTRANATVDEVDETPTFLAEEKSRTHVAVKELDNVNTDSDANETRANVAAGQVVKTLAAFAGKSRAGIAVDELNNGNTVVANETHANAGQVNMTPAAFAMEQSRAGKAIEELNVTFAKEVSRANVAVVVVRNAHAAFPSETACADAAVGKVARLRTEIEAEFALVVPQQTGTAVTKKTRAGDYQVMLYSGPTLCIFQQRMHAMYAHLQAAGPSKTGRPTYVSH